MKVITAFSLLLLLSLRHPASVAADQPGTIVPDILYRHSGGILSGRILDADSHFVRIEVTLDAGRKGVVSIPLPDIDRATFAPNSHQQVFLKAAQYEDYPKLLALWTKRRALLPVEGSDAAAIGLALARTLAQSRVRAEIEDALALYQFLETNAVQPDHLAAARRGRLQTLILLDQADQAVAEARILLETSDDPTLLIEAQFVLAEAARRDFETLIEANPRWHEDTEIRPKRNLLYHRIIELYLFPFLFHGSEKEPVARSLGRLLSFLEQTGNLNQARSIARDLLQLYPNQKEATVARRFLDTFPKPNNIQHQLDET